MEKVKVKTVNPIYDGMIKGYQFFRGQAEVLKADVEALKEFGVELVQPEAPEKAETKTVKRSPRKKGE